MSLIVFNSKSHSFAYIKLNTRREIPYLHAPMYYSLYNNDILLPYLVTGYGSTRN